MKDKHRIPRMEVDDVKWNLYHADSIDFVLSESEKFLKESIQSFRELTNWCFYALGIYIAILSFCINKIISSTACFVKTPYFIIILVSISCILILFPTLMPGKMVILGANPKLLLVEHFEKIQVDQQMIEYKKQTIIANANGASANLATIKSRIKRLKISILVFVIATSFASCNR
jgi:hypothetical protein